MELKQNETYLIRFIKYFPILFILVISLMVTVYISNEHKKALKEEKKLVREQFLRWNKDIIKIGIEKTVSRYIEVELNNTNKKLKANLKKNVENTHRIMTSIYEKYKDTKSKAEIIELIKNTIRPIRFNNGRGYFFIVNFNGINILNAGRPSLEGKNNLELKDVKGNSFIQQSIKIAKSEKGEGFKKFWFKKPNQGTMEYEKIGFVKRFSPYNWYIGTGEYIEDFKNEVKKNILEHLSILRYKDDEYVFVVDYDGNVILSKNKIFNEKKSKEISFLVKDFINLNKEFGFVEYEVIRNNKKKYEKISYVKKIDSLRWIVGTGFDFDRFEFLLKEKYEVLEKNHKEHLTMLYTVSFIMTIILLIISFIVSNYLKKSFLFYKKKILEKQKIKFELVLKELEDVFNNIPMLVSYKDTKNNILMGNKALADEAGLKTKDLRNIHMKKFFPKSHDKYYLGDLEVIKTKKAKVGSIERYERDDKEYIMEVSRFPVFDEKGEVTNIIVFLSDITEKERFRNENEKKDRIIYQQSKLVSMGEMLANIAHQLKQPLSAISVASSGMKLKKDMNCLSDEDFYLSVDAIDVSTKYLAQTIDDFRNFFKPCKERYKEFDVVDAVDKTFKLVNAKFKSQNIEIIKNIGNIKINSSQNDLVQVLINILSNARDELIKYNFRRLLFIDVYEKENKVFIEIKDNGKGIPKGLEEKIFESYFTTKEDTGTGLGLYMSKDIISKLLMGTLEVENETYSYDGVEYTGAKFTIKLPLKQKGL